ncbi:RDD family protein [Roseiconus nitratireducens]|uniref:RDD family protein n=1 Tax=Roseiconus nitratireducens TaxID=2605748 RepID=UPI001375F4CA|nr:RDD family protein [Roseiconus nitratireducens]
MNDINPYAATTETIEDPYGYQGGSELATRGQRLLGAIIDGLIQMVIVVPLGIALGMVIAMTLGDGMVTQLVANVAGGILGFLVFLALNGYLLATQGKTIGKLAIKTRIVDRDTGQLVPFWPLIGKRYLWLWLIAPIPFFNFIVPLINVLLIFRENRACLHDDIAHTKVIADA